MTATAWRAALAVLSALALMSTGCSAGGATHAHGSPGTLRVGIIPNISPETQRAHYEPFRKYLADRLKTDVELFVATNYAGVVSALAGKKLDIAYLGGLTYVQAEAQTKVTPLVTEVDQETGTPEYLSAIVAKADASFRSAKDVVAAGGKFAFGDVSSTSGSLYPRVMLVDAGARCQTGDLTACPPLASVAFTGGHDATAQAVASGSVDAGGIELRILHRLEKQGSVPKGALKVVETREVMGYPWVAGPDLTGETRDAVINAFTAMSDPKLLDLMRAKAYVKVSAADYADVRKQATDLGLLTAP
ncbi:putative selenate ABC transporter substrate-binding protein [Planomonospora parontospora subsp. parontospora]|uniref:Selenate ABC transporter substrate-binding protein n=2 Tax=Planomonospora parontospora TaxID=58119 RepID=A0AA37BIF7_9ACTN|nr:phosphate/phosphite/phosphonate ABC transporter substrate-binding protein [Planomonospora parontospora]GGK76578.1 putative selenate ABC transporter substrate-binding protein [Planomonospora parontospora]GII10115.1 putative selenate ABC transporter substrate-binding protein [Planomonospora parontospora subsp. parontospora]